MSVYPSEVLLEKIRNYDLGKETVTTLIELIRDNWHFATAGYFVLKGKRILKLELHTGGWSGNEDIISALRKNELFFLRYWQKEKRGGHYYFRIELPKRRGHPAS